MSDIESILALPADARFDYYAEGAANVVYRLRPRAVAAVAAPSDPLAHSKLPRPPSTEISLLLDRQKNGLDATTTFSEDSTIQNGEREGKPPEPRSQFRTDTANPDPKLTDDSNGSQTEADPAASSQQEKAQGLILKKPYPLLRLRKTLSHTTPIIEQHDLQDRLITPLFPANTVLPYRLISIPPSTLHRLNDALRAAEAAGTRAAKRHGTYLETTEPHGVIVEDMSSSSSENDSYISDHPILNIEFKPKWLVQSLTAPPGSFRCRTCALEAMRRNKHTLPSTATSASKYLSFCPLDLASREREGIERAVDVILLRRLNFSTLDPALNTALRDSDNAPVAAADVKNRITEFLLQSPILPRLAELQRDLDPKGVLDLMPGVERKTGDEQVPVPVDFQVATTLRDCTLFLRAEVGGNGSVEGMLGDLDLKRPEWGKLEYWGGIERELVEGGWYGGRDTVCRLSR
ncbi:MAG: Inositol-pentakisphosphate 2-kinase [Alyxoria varia]|nr:MAG: Inositol-pentakisphosphate 2-kinase [Alyxoria varia]